jgi:hypothetical protein
MHRTSHNIVYSELGWETLVERRRKQRLRVFYKTVNQEVPIYLENVLPNPIAQQNQYNLRHESNYPPIRAQTSAFQNTFFPKTISDWNNLEDDTKLSESVDSFTYKLNKNRVKIPSWYYCGDRRLTILHARLRMLCSPLNDHLYSLVHVVDNPSCSCGKGD